LDLIDKKTIALDMDGVLFDLDAGLKEHCGEDIYLDMPNRSELFKSYLPAYAKDNGFATQPLMPRAKELVNFVLSQGTRVIILTSHGDFYDHSEIVRQKKAALIEHFPKLDIPFCATSSGAQKSVLANPRMMLIDDHHKNVERFIASGGFGTIYNEDRYDHVVNDIVQFTRI
jgi:5'(3')-deoxyribonucleotidase